MPLNPVVFRHNDKTEWETPKLLFDRWNNEFHFTLDAAASAQNAKCADYFTEEQNALEQLWTGRVWCNPPYDRRVIAQWLEKAQQSVASGTAQLVVMLLPARTSNKWFHNYCWPYRTEIRFVEGRIQFVGAQTGAPFPSMLVIWRSTTGS